MISRMEWDRVKQKWIKYCTMCEVIYEGDGAKWVDGVKSLSKFFSPNKDKHDSLAGRCKECQSHLARKRTPGVNRSEMLKAQDNKCFLCAETFPENNYFICIDHDIETGVIRKLLCKRCNIRMAAVDDEQWLTKAIEYRDNHRKQAQIIKLGQGKLQ